MKSIARCLVVLCAFNAPAAWSEESPPKKPNPQHQRMKDCHAQAKSQALKGEERKAFVSQCLKAESAKAKK